MKLQLLTLFLLLLYFTGFLNTFKISNNYEKCRTSLNLPICNDSSPEISSFETWSVNQYSPLIVEIYDCGFAKSNCMEVHFGVVNLPIVRIIL